MTRERLPDRREGHNETLHHTMANGGTIDIETTFNQGPDGCVREAFCLAFKEGSEYRALLHHACIIASVGLQHGAAMADYLHALGEDDFSKAPTSILSLICRAGVKLDEENGLTREAQP